MGFSDITGLTQAEVEHRKQIGQVNVNPDGKKGKSVGMIILTNTLTFFNVLNIVFFVLIMMVGSFKNGLFLWIIIVNSVIGIIQELRTKRMLDKLSLLSQSKTTVLRDGKEAVIPITEIVLDDVIKLSAGAQIPSDSLIMKGEIEVNESLLTGESDDIMKRPGDAVLSGSFVTSGSAYAKVSHVGKDNYIESISGEAKKFIKVKSELRNSINKILRVVAFAIIPLSVGLFCKLYFLQNETFRSAIEQVVSSGIGMIPEGLYLLTTLALTLGVMRLAKKKTLVQELYSIESLARVDVLCLDKTGTLTEGRMEVETAVLFKEGGEREFETAVTNVLEAQNSLNETGKAVMEYYGSAPEKWALKHVIPFSSERKYSGASFSGKGTYYMGAVQYLCPGNSVLLDAVRTNAEKGYRVLAVAHSIEEKTDNVLSGYLEPLGYLVLSDLIRSDCRETLNFFKENGVALKCISGDDPVTVSKIASACGFEHAEEYIDVSGMKNKEELREAVRTYSVFGRVRPEQKKWMVECLQEDGHTV
ncbi:MAG: HAD-IC family P-type ATPase, partial [Lachnospiraceae bacterium]|nr:HAD-IC family P-type ATPase [Lachnospiraceae bacterium]